MMNLFHPSEKTLSRYQDRLLPENQQQKLNRHLENCPLCQRKFQLLEGVRIHCQVPVDKSGSLQRMVMERLATPDWKTKSPVIGIIESLSGVLWIKGSAAAPELEAFPEMALHPGDILKTSSDGRALIRWSDGSQIYLNRETQVEIPMTVQRISLNHGEIYSMMKPQASPFVIKTPGALLTVLGTDFSVEVSETHKTLLNVYRGKVAYENEKGKVIAHKKESVDASPYLCPRVKPVKGQIKYRDWVKPLSLESKEKGEEKMIKYLLAVILVLVLIGGFLAYKVYLAHTSQTPAAVPSTISAFPSQPNEKGVAVIEAMNKGDFTSVEGLFDTSMHAAINAQKLSEIWKSTQDQLGTYQSQLGVNVTKEIGFDTVYVTCLFAKGTADIKLVFNSKGEMSGLWLLPANSVDLTQKGTVVSESEAIPLAISYADKLINKDYEGMVAGFDGTMKSALTASTLKTTWEGLEKQAGAFKKRAGTRSVPLAGSQVVYVTCVFEKASLDIKIVFDTQKKISGLWIIPTGNN